MSGSGAATPAFSAAALHQPSPPFFSYPIPTPPSISTDASSTTTMIAGLKHKSAVRRLSSITLRALAFAFSFGSSIALAVPSPEPRARKEDHFSFRRYPEFKYCLVSVILASIYSAGQLLKDVWNELAYKGFVISSKSSEIITFCLDQVMAYLLFSSSSVAAVGAGRITHTAFHTAAVISLVLSFAAYIAMAGNALRSGYLLCKRLIW